MNKNKKLNKCPICGSDHESHEYQLLNMASGGGYLGYVCDECFHKLESDNSNQTVIKEE